MGHKIKLTPLTTSQINLAIKGLEEGKWLTRNFTVVNKDNVITRFLKHSINKIFSCFGKTFYTDSNSKEVLKHFETAFKAAVSKDPELRANLQSVTKLFTAFDHATHFKHHRQLAVAYQEYGQELAQETARPLKLLTHTLEDSPKKPSFKEDCSCILNSWNAYVNSLKPPMIQASNDIKGFLQALEKPLKPEEMAKKLDANETVYFIHPDRELSEQELSCLTMYRLQKRKDGQIEIRAFNPSNINKGLSITKSPNINEFLNSLKIDGTNRSLDEPLTRISVINGMVQAIVNDYPIHQVLHKAFILNEVRPWIADLKSEGSRKLWAWFKDMLVAIETERDALSPQLQKEFSPQIQSLKHFIAHAYDPIIAKEADLKEKQNATEKTALAKGPNQFTALTSSTEITLQAHIPPNQPLLETGPVAFEVVPERFKDIDFVKGDLETITQQFDAWMKGLDHLREQEQFDHVDRAIMFQMSNLTLENIEVFIKKVPAEESVKWIDRFSHLIESLTLVHLGLARSCLPHNHIPVLLETFSIIQDLYRMDPSINFGSTFRMKDVETALKDPYLDLGMHGPEVIQILKHLETPAQYDNRGRIDLNELDDQYYYRFSKADQREVFEKLDKIRHTYFYLSMLLIPSTLAADPIPGNRVTTRENYLKDKAKVKEKLSQFKGTLYFENPKKEEYYEEEPQSGIPLYRPSTKQHYVTVQPLGLRLYRPVEGYYLNYMYQNYTTGVATPYGNQRAPIKQPRIRRRIAEAVVSKNDSYVSESGENCHDEDFQYMGMHTTQQALQDEYHRVDIFKDCSPDLCRELELMQTAPDDRVRNTILLFSKHSYLLKDSDWQRVCELNCFRYGYLYHQLCENSAFASELSAHLAIMVNKAKKGEIPLAFLTPFLAQIKSIISSASQSNERSDSVKWNSVLLDECHKKVTELTTEMLALHDKQLCQEEEAIKKEEEGKISKEYETNCRAFLFAQSVLAHDLSVLPKDLVPFLPRYLWLCSLPRSDIHEDMMASIHNSIDLNLPRIGKYLKNHPERVPDITAMKDIQEWQPDKSGIVWQTNSHVLNLQTGRLGLREKDFLTIPLSLRGELKGLVSPQNLRKQFDYTTHQFSGRKWQQIQFKEENHNLKIFICKSKNIAPIVLMQMEDGLWYQRQRMPMAISRDLGQCVCWSNLKDHKVCFIDPTGRLRYKGTWKEPKTIVHLEQCFDKGPKEVYWPTSRTPIDETPFLKLDSSQGLLLLGKDNQVQQVSYPTLGLAYQWHAEQKKWISTLHPGYALVTTPLQISPLKQEDVGKAQVTGLFSSSFRDYHLLESASGPSKLVLTDKQYQIHPQGIDLRMRENIRQVVSVGEPTKIYTYEIDPERGLRAESPEGYLYLSYLLCTQGKYPQAAIAMRRGFNRMQGLSSEAQKIINYFENWKTNEPNAIALQMHLKLFIQEQNLIDSVDGLVAMGREASLPPLLDEYENYVRHESKIDPQLRLTAAMQRKIRLAAPRSYQWINQQLNQKVSQFKTWQHLLSLPRLQNLLLLSDHEVITKLKTEIPKIIAEGQQERKYEAERLDTHNASLAADLQALLLTLEEAYPKFKSELQSCWITGEDLNFYLNNGLIGTVTFLNTTERRKKEQALLNWVLEREIQERMETLPSLKNVPATEVTPALTAQPLFTIPLDPYLEYAENKPAQQKVMRKGLDQLSEAFATQGNSFAAEMAKDLVVDTYAYCESIGESIAKEEEEKEKQAKSHERPYQQVRAHADLEQLNTQLNSQKSTLATTEETVKKSIAKQFKLGSTPHSFLRRLKDQDPVVEDLFQQGCWCYGEKNWSSLVNRGVITENQIPLLEKTYKEYLIARTQLAQTEKALKQVNTYQSAKANKPLEGAKLATLLQQKRHYDVDTHPYAAALLLIENELDIICDAHQVSHFLDMINHRSAFKHEAWGGGKTTVLRHLISKIHANGGYLSSLLTHAPLISSHHKQLKESTASVYGQQAFRSDFSRISPTDSIALKRELLKLILMVEEQGRTDQTINALISMRHAYNLKALQFNPNQEDKEAVAAAFDAINTFGRLLNFKQERMVIGSDELDQLFTPDRQNNYATGGSIPLSEKFYDPAFAILNLLNQPRYQAFAPYFTQTQPKDLNDKERAELLDMLAEDLIKKYDLSDLDKTALKTFWAPPSPSISADEYERQKQFYKEIICTHPQAKLLQCLQIYLSKILPLSFDKTCGVAYGRSEDAIHTKPCSDSGVCLEKSQHGSILLLIWYSCLDYWRVGITEKTVKAYITRLTQKAYDQRTGVSSIGDTTIGKQFAKSFKMALEDVTPQHFASIAEKINSTIALKEDCLRVANFETMNIYTNRLMGNGKQAAHDVLEIWGSSGNSERVRTLPNKVQKLPELMRQKGTMGRIFYNIMKDYSEGDIVTFSRQESFAKCLVPKLKPGQAIVDVAPFFEGLTPEECVTALQNEKLSIPVRYISSEGLIRVRLSNQQDILFQDSSLSVNDCVTLYTHKDRRGVDLQLPSNCENWMTVSSDTTFTNYSQGGMRARQWGRGSKFRFIVDPGFKAAIEQRPYLQGVDLSIQMLALFIENEAAELQRLHTMANHQEIVAIGDAAVQQSLRHSDTPQSLKTLTDIFKQFNYLEQNAEFNLEAQASPMRPISGEQSLKDLVVSERKKIERLKEVVGKSEGLSSHSRAFCFEALDKALLSLSDSKIVMKPQYLSPIITAADTHTQIEEVEVEQQAEVQAEIEQEAEVEQIALKEHEKEVEEQRVDFEGEESNLSSSLHWSSTTLLTPGELVNVKQELPGMGHKIKGSPGTSFYHTPILDADQWKKPRGTGTEYGMWVDGQEKKRQLLAPSVLLVMSMSGKMVSVMGTTKDADLAFEPYAHKYQNGNNKNRDEDIAIHYKFDDQRDLDEALKPFPAEVREQAIDYIVFSKIMLGGGVKFSKTEQERLPIVWKKLEKAYPKARLHLKNYVEYHFAPKDRQLLTLLNIT